MSEKTKAVERGARLLAAMAARYDRSRPERQPQPSKAQARWHGRPVDLSLLEPETMPGVDRARWPGW